MHQSGHMVAQMKSDHCPNCGAALAQESLGGVCAKCLARAIIAPDESDVEESLPRSFGDYELLEKIAHGGMGVVYRARQISLNRIVAVKMLLAGEFATREFVQRFKGESAAAALLRHPNIVAIHEVGVHDGRHYFSMEYVAGKSLTELVREKLLHAVRAAHYVRLIAEAIHYAHQRGTLHRDLKPSNVLLDDFDQPRVTDFGLAKQVEGNSDLTLSGQVLGTPSFMPPEQAAGKRGAMGPASDVYSLGAILYHLVTGRPPFVAESMAETLRLVEDAEPVSPRLLNPGVPRDLETICLKCLAKTPAGRYATAQALADELARFVRDEPIRARPVRGPEKLWRWCRRRPLVATLVVALHLVFAAGLAGVLVELGRAERAESDSKEKLHGSYLAKAQAARQTLQAGRRETILTAVRSAAAIRPSIELRNEAIAAFALTDLGEPRSWRDFPPTNGWQWSGWAGMNADLDQYVLGTPAGDLSIRRAKDQRELLRLSKVGAEGYKPVFSQDGHYLALRSWNGWVRVWDLNRRVLVVRSRLSSELNGSLEFTPDSRWFAAGAKDKLIHFHALTNNMASLNGDSTGANFLDDSSAPETRPTRFLSITLAPESIRFDPTGHRLVVANGNQWQVWEWERPRLILAQSQPSNVAGMAWHPDGRSLATGSDDGTIFLWDIASGSHRVLRGHDDLTTVLSFHPRGDVLASSSWDGTTRLWDIHAGQAVLSTEQGFNIRFNRNGERLAFYRENQDLGIWPIIPSRVFRTLADTPGIKRIVDRVDFSPDGASLVWRDGDGIWWLNLATGELRQRKVPGVNCVLFDPSAGSANLFTAGAQGLWRWPLLRSEPSSGTLFRLGEPQLLMNTIDGNFLRMEMAAGGRRALAGTHSWTISDRDAEPRTIECAKAVNDLAISPDQRWVALGHWDGITLVCDAQTGRVVKEWPGERSAAVGFTPDSHWLVTATGQEYRFWETGSWRPGWRFERQLATRISGPIAFSRDGRLMALARTMRLVQLVDLRTGETLAELNAPTPQIIFRLTLSPDGGLLACSGSEGIQLWDLRALRQELAALRLDWDQPPHPPSALSLATVVFHVRPEPPQPPNIPPRLANARPQLIDLTKFYNASLKEPWLPRAALGNDLAALPSGLQTLGGIEFDLRGLIQLRSARPADAQFPEHIEGIPLAQKCQRLHFLHAAHGSMWISSTNFGKPLARYVVRYADGVSEEIPIIYARDVCNWWKDPNNPTSDPPPVWTGRNAAADTSGSTLRLYHTAWENRRPGVEVRSLDLISTLTESAPFVVAITVE